LFALDLEPDYEENGRYRHAAFSVGEAVVELDRPVRADPTSVILTLAAPAASSPTPALTASPLQHDPAGARDPAESSVPVRIYPPPHWLYAW
jgi:hypothetical protein